MPDLQHAILNWDGKSAADIKAIYDAFATQASFVDDLLSLLKDSAAQKGATWLLKHRFEQNELLSTAQTQQFCNSFVEMQHWESRLHCFQCVPYLTIAIKDADAVYAFIQTGLTDKKKFVKAWAYNALNELAGQHPQYQAEADEKLAWALTEEAPSVRARIRNIMQGK